MAKIADVQEVSLEKLRPYERNAKKHGPGQIEKLKASIIEFGFLTPCLIDSDYNLIAGHGRVMAAKELGIKTVPCVFIEGLTDEQRRAYILADNRLGELGEWDMELVSDELENLRDNGLDIDLTGFSIDDIIIEDDMGADFTEDEFEDFLAETEPIVKFHEIYQLGDHRLMCGDSTDAGDVSTLMNKVKADLVVTDPPYNVSLGQNESTYGLQKRHRRTDGLFIANDALSDDEFYAFLCKAFKNASDNMKLGASYYCWYASTTQWTFQTALEAEGLKPHQILIWVKNTASLGRSDYQWRHEPCFYGWKEGGPHYFIDLRTLTTVTDGIETLTKEEAIARLKELADTSTAMYENKPQKSAEHPTMKPLNLIKKQVRNSSKEGDAVLDLFGGSGTTLLACEEMGRKCYMMEYDPHYCDVIIKRWETQTGRKAVLLNG